MSFSMNYLDLKETVQNSEELKGGKQCENIDLVL